MRYPRENYYYITLLVWRAIIGYDCQSLSGPNNPPAEQPIVACRAQYYNRPSSAAKNLLNTVTITPPPIPLQVKDTLLNLRDQDLELISPHLDTNEQLITALSNFESTFKRCKKCYLEPDNLI